MDGHSSLCFVLGAGVCAASLFWAEPAAAYHTKEQRLTDESAYTLRHKDFRVGLWKTQYGIIDSITAGGSATLVFGSVSGRSYTIEYKDDLEGSQWRKLTDVPARQDNGFEQVVDPAFTASRYYRLITPRQL